MNGSTLRDWVRAVLTILCAVWAGIFLYRAAFTPAAEGGKSLDVILGFVLTGLLAVIIRYYWGAAEHEEDDDAPPK